MAKYGSPSSGSRPAQADQPKPAPSCPFAEIVREVAETRGVIESVNTLVGRLAQRIRDNAENPAALKTLADDLGAQQKAIGDAVKANPIPGTVLPTA